MTNMTEYASGKDWSASGAAITGKGNATSDFRGLQADLNAYAQTAGFDGVKIDGAIGPKTLEAVQKVVSAVKAKNAMVPTTFPEIKDAAGVAQYAQWIREWLQTMAAKTLGVTTQRVYQKGTGKDWNIKGEIAYGAGAVHDDFLQLQQSLNKFADVAGFKKLEVDGFIGPATAAATKAVFDKVVAKNSLLGVTLFPPPDTKEEAAEYAAFIRQWLNTTASKTLLAEAGV